MGMMLCILGWILFGINNGLLDKPDPVLTGMSVGFFLSALIISTLQLFNYDKNFQDYS